MLNTNSLHFCYRKPLCRSYWRTSVDVICFMFRFNPLSANPTNWSNTLKQFVSNFLTNCLRVFDHFVKLALKGLRKYSLVLCNIIYTISFLLIQVLKGLSQPFPLRYNLSSFFFITFSILKKISNLGICLLQFLYIKPTSNFSHCDH